MVTDARGAEDMRVKASDTMPGRAPIRPALRPVCALLVWLLLASAGCSDDPEPTYYGSWSKPVQDCGPLPDDVGGDGGGLPDGAGSQDSGQDGAAFSLTPCQQACDKVASCGVADCAGWSWAGAGELWAACAAVCDGALAASILGTDSCKTVRQAVATRDARFEGLCKSNPCQLSCDKLAGCVVQECEKVGPASQGALMASCLKDCKAETTQWVLTKTCAEIVGAIASSDPSFQNNCHPAPSKCAAAEPCQAYAAKATGCIQAHCAGHADPYAKGLQAVIADYCHAGADCPDPGAVAAVNAPSVTCESPGLKQIGPAPPFTALCQGTLGVTPAQAKAACDKVVACPGLEMVGSVDKCMVLFAMRPDVVKRVQCLTATTTCQAVYACLEGL